jgi:hypothetical protein
MEEPRNAKGLLLVTMDVEPDYEAEFNRWYNEEHLPERLSCPGILSGRRFRVVEGAPRYLALYDLESPAVLNTPEYRMIYPPSAWRTRIDDHLNVVNRSIYSEITPEIPAGYIESMVVERP